MTGNVRSIHHDKKFGFIRAEDNQDYFFHQQDLANKALFFEHIEVGTQVFFEPSSTVKGLRARNVVV